MTVPPGTCATLGGSWTNTWPLGTTIGNYQVTRYVGKQFTAPHVPPPVEAAVRASTCDGTRALNVRFEFTGARLIASNAGGCG